MAAAIAVLGYLNLQILLAPPPPDPAAPPDPMAFGTVAVTQPSDPIAAMIDLPGEPLDHEPGHIAPYPGAELMHRFMRRGTAVGEAVSIRTLPPDVSIEAALDHYRTAADDAGFTQSQAARPGTLQRTDPATGRALMLRVAPGADGRTHATLAMRYAIPTDPTDPARSASP